MGTIVVRPRQDKTTAYMAKIIIKREGRIAHRESKTFPRRAAAAAWIARREEELNRPGVVLGARTGADTLAEAIKKYSEANAGMGRTKEQVLNSLAKMPIAKKQCGNIFSTDLVDLATDLGVERQPQTVGNYMSHLQAVFAVADDAWGLPLDQDEMAKAMRACKRLGLISKSNRRDSRPTLEELDMILNYYEEMSERGYAELPMTKLVVFALFSTRRQEEITRIRQADYEGSRALIRDMKHPGQKKGNNVWCELVPEAQRVADSMPKGELLFPFNSRSISASFTRACRVLGIEDLHFHDLRHEGISRLFEMGWAIPRAAQVSGHRSWASLQRYTHIQQTGDKYADWKWIEIASRPAA